MSDLSKLNQSMLICRDLGHAWNEGTAEHVEHKNEQLVERSMYCSRCDTRRTEFIRRDGITVKRRYRYPIGYLPLHPVTRRQARLYNLQLALAKLKKRSTT